ncbi:ubiquitin-conjugating enzyme E2 Q2-like isoform X5 [Macaca nemestrina]|uniref:ubiquitin-conjugating enzyme E2 Q2-like isoform X5 n=1 Tax=Macaca nemestrina TaxID=9545 RepID=UPI0039B9921F
MSVSGFKAKLKLLASLPQEPGAQPPLTLHCNITNGTTEEVTSDEEEEEEEEMAEDIEDLDHYEMKEEPISGEKLEDEGIEKENLAILEKIRQDHLNVITFQLILHLFEWCYLFSQEGMYWVEECYVWNAAQNRPFHTDLLLLRAEAVPTQ